LLKEMCQEGLGNRDAARLEQEGSVMTGVAAQPTCIVNKAISCAPDRQPASKEDFSGDSRMKCEVRKTGRCASVRAGTYKMHRTVKERGAANIKFLQAAFSSQVTASCRYIKGLDDYRDCQPVPSEASGGVAASMNTASDKEFIKEMMDRAYKSGWTPMTLLDGTWYFVGFELNAEDTVTYQCANNDLCRQEAADI